MTKLRKLVFVISLFAFLFLKGASAQTTEITYQGQLQNSSAPANGKFDFEFLLFDAVTGGTQIGSTLTRSSVAVANGLFSVSLDFGASFPGANRFLEIHVKQTGVGSFTSLFPRQAFTSTPYAVKSLISDTATNAGSALTAVNATNTVNFSGGLSGDVSGIQSATVVTAVGGQSAANVANAAQSNNAATSNNVANTLVKRDASGNFAAGTITGNLTGNATTATNAANAASATSAINATTATNATQLGGIAANQYQQTNGSGASLTNLNATNIATGTLNNARLGQIPTANIADSAVTASKIASGQVVKSVNALKDDVTFAAGSNITITPSGNTLTIASTAGGNPILNQQTQQAGANFNIDGNGTVGGTLSANIVNTNTQYNIAGNRILSNPGQDNLFAGLQAGVSNTGSNNSFFGRLAGASNSSGASNSFFGKSAGGSNATGSLNSFFGTSAGLNSTGGGNSFFGADAGLGSTTGSENSFFGVSAGSSNGGGNRNSFFGRSAGRVASGTDNSYFGVDAGLNSTIGSFNSFFGSSVGIKNTNNGNSFFGWLAGTENANGFSNSFFGALAGSANVAGGNNTFFGFQAGRVNTGGTGNTAVGALADFGFANLTNATAIGADARVDAPDTMVLGKVGTRIVIGATGNGAFAANTRAARLNIFGGDPWTSNNWSSSVKIQTGGAIGWDISGSYGFGLGATNGGLYFFRAGTYIGSPDTAAIYDMVITDTGNIGVGITNPGAKLDVNGTARVRSIPIGAPLAQVCFNNIGDLLNCSSSSLRLKKNVHAYSDGLNILRRLNPISYNWKETGAADIGLGAEDVAKVAPFFAFRNNEGVVEGVRYERLTMVLINAVKEQQTQIEQQQAITKKQAAEIDALKSLVCRHNRRAAVCKPVK